MNDAELAHGLVAWYPAQFGAAAWMPVAGHSHLALSRRADGDPGGRGCLGRLVPEAP
jgi:type IV secretory pathway TrbD component